MRCNTGSYQATVTIKWDVETISGDFDVLALDEYNFNKYLQGNPYTCINYGCRSSGTPQKQKGEVTASGAQGYYVVVADHSIGKSAYVINASVK